MAHTRAAVALLLTIVALAAPAAAEAQQGAAWQFGGSTDRSGRGPGPSAPPFTGLYRQADAGAVVTAPVITASSDPAATTVAYGTSDGHVRMRRLLDGTAVGPAAGVSVDDGDPDTGVLGPAALTVEGSTVLALHNDDGQIEIARISTVTGALIDDVPVPGTSGLAARSAPALARRTTLWPHVPPFFEALYFVAADRLFRVPAGAYPEELRFDVARSESTAVAGLNPLASPTVLPAIVGKASSPGRQDCPCFPVRIAVAKAGGLSILEGGTLEGQTPADVSFEPDGMAGTPTATRLQAVGAVSPALLVPVSEGSATTVVAVDPWASPIAVLDESVPLPGTPGPAIASSLPDPGGVIAVGTTANLYLLDAQLDETARLSATPLAEDRAFGTVAPAVTRDRTYAMRADGTPLILDANARPLDPSQFAPPDDMTAPGAEGAFGQPALEDGVVFFGGPRGVAAFRDLDVEPPSGFAWVKDVVAGPDGTHARISGEVTLEAVVRDRMPTRATFRVLPYAGGDPVAILTATARPGGGPWEADTLPRQARLMTRWQTRSVPDGIYRLSTVAEDAAGHTTTLDGPWPFTVANAVVAPSKAGRCANLRTGRNGDDRLLGTELGDRLVGLGGNDRLSGGTGADCLDGGPGRDRLEGGADDDRLAGGSGRDRLLGGAGDDRIRVGSGANRVAGGPGRDTIIADNGRRDALVCGAGRRDRVVADRLDRVARSCERVTRRR